MNDSTPQPDTTRVVLVFGIAVLGLLAIPSLGGYLLDVRELRGVNVWDKPLKFEFSLGLHLATLLLAVHFVMASEQRVRRTVHASVLAVTFCTVMEALYIALQASRGRESHFNRDTPLETFLYYGAMGTGALVIVAGSIAVGVLLLRQERSRPSSGLAYGMALGLVVGGVATLVAVVPLSSGMVDGLGHWVGGVRSDAQGMPLTGWSTTGGDLRVPHFFATHLMQALPLAGWTADRAGVRDDRRLLHGLAVAGVALVAATLFQAIRGLPLLPLLAQTQL